MTTICFDYDPLLYTAGSVGETRTIKVVHRESGDEYEFSNRTAFWGHHKKKAGGWLAMYNETKAEENKRKPEDFDITDVQTPEPIAQCLHTLKRQIEMVKESVGAHLYYGYSGKGEVFRHDVSTVLKYKGNRDNALRPMHLDEMKEYLVKFQGCKIVTGIEADDACTMDAYNAYNTWEQGGKQDKDKLWLAFVDKDYWQCRGHLLHIDKGIQFECDGGFGRLWLDTKGKQPVVKGYGRMWLYYQVMNGDDSDNYFANSANPDLKWAMMSAFDTLKGAKNDKEAFEALKRGYQTIYPAPMKITGWRGNELEVDWLYMLQENFTLAKMLRWQGDAVDVKKVMEKMGIEV